MNYDYYTDVWSKVADFVLGFLGYPVIALLVQVPFGGRMPKVRVMSGDLAWQAVLLCVTIVAIVFAFKRGRKFIGIGIISFLIIPLIAIGSCFLVMMQMSGH